MPMTLSLPMAAVPARPAALSGRSLHAPGSSGRTCTGALPRPGPGALPRAVPRGCTAACSPLVASATGNALGRRSLGGAAVSTSKRRGSLWTPAGQPLRRPRGPTRIAMMPEAAEVLELGSGGNPLLFIGQDFLTFLASTVLVIPVCARFGISPILGFLASGTIASAGGLLRDADAISEISELGVLFLLFEMGLELSSDRLRTLARYAFGMGTLQMIATTAVFAACALPVGQGPVSILLTKLGADPSLVSIRSVDEAVVIGVSLALSSSAFVLQILGEKGELSSKFGSATLGVLLLQDIAVVPFLVLLPLVETQDIDPTNISQDLMLIQQLWPQALTSLGALGMTILGGKLFLRRAISAIGKLRSPETFLAMCLLTVVGTSSLTAALGYSDSMGAFLAGVLLSESNFKSQVESDIAPFKGILLGLFFFSTGASIDPNLFVENWPIVMTLVFGLITVKAAILTSLGPRFGLSKAESVRTGLVLSQGGEFAFVLLALSQQLDVLPTELNKILITVVVISMSLTPSLQSLGDYLGQAIEEAEAAIDPWASIEGSMGSMDMDETLPEAESAAMLMHTGNAKKRKEREDIAQIELFDPIIIVGFEGVGPTVAKMVSSPTLSPPEPCVVFDESEAACSKARKAGVIAACVDCTSGKTKTKTKTKSKTGTDLDNDDQLIDIEDPRSIVICFEDRERAINAVTTMRARHPSTRILAHAQDETHSRLLYAAGADMVTNQVAEPGLGLGSELLRGLGVLDSEVRALRSHVNPPASRVTVLAGAATAKAGSRAKK